MVIAGVFLGILAILGFRHARKGSAMYTKHPANVPEYATASR
jgi:hypothetical protein